MRSSEETHLPMTHSLKETVSSRIRVTRSWELAQIHLATALNFVPFSTGIWPMGNISICIYGRQEGVAEDQEFF